MKIRYFLSSLLVLLAVITVKAEDYIVIKNNTKVFDMPVAKDEFASRNNNDEFVELLPGMAFKVTEKKTGWDVIEYSPGLRGMVMQNMESAKNGLKTPVAGNYKVANNSSESVSVTVNGNVWSLKSKGSTFSGRLYDNVVVFFDKDVNPAYTLVSMAGKPYVYNYSNKLTKFF